MTKNVNLPWKLEEPFKAIATQNEFEALVKCASVVDCLYKPDFLGPSDSHTVMRLKKVHFKNVSFAKTELKRISFSKCSFTNCLFIGAILSECEFYHCEFKSCNFHKIRLVETSLDPTSVQDCFDHKQHTNIALHLYGELRKSSLQIENPEFASRAGYSYHRWIRHHLVFKYKSRREHIWRFLVQWSANIVLDFVIGFGWRVRRFAVSTVVMLGLFSTWNYLMWTYLDTGETGFTEPTIVRSLYYTVITMTTLGYGDITPSTPIGMLAASFQAAVGVVWVGLLIGVSVRKVLP